MAQITDGLRSILSSPLVYLLFQKIMGADRNTQKFADSYIHPEAGMTVLDVGCGPADILAYLPPVDYWGYDISAPYIAHAKNRYGERGKFFCKVLSKDDLTSLPKFDIVLLLGVLHHLDDCVAKDLMSLINQLLKPHGRLVTMDACIAPHQNRVARFLISKDRGRNVRDELGYRGLVANVFSDVRVTVRNQTWIPYTHCIMECTK